MDSHWTSSGRGWGLTFGTDETPACFHHQHCQIQQPKAERGGERRGGEGRGGEGILEHDQFLYFG